MAMMTKTNLKEFFMDMMMDNLENSNICDDEKMEITYSLDDMAEQFAEDIGEYEYDEMDFPKDIHCDLICAYSDWCEEHDIRV